VQYAKSFDLFNESWVDFDVVLKNIPRNQRSGTIFTRNNRIEVNDSNYYYLVSIQDYRLRNDEAPMEYVKKTLKT
jgi:hypothetical protein